MFYLFSIFLFSNKGYGVDFNRFDFHAHEIKHTYMLCAQIHIYIFLYNISYT